MNIHERVAYRYLYARLLLAMSMDEAKRVLGFPPASSPSPQDVSRAYRDLAFKNHPDRGGDPKKMVEINVAKDVLEGKGRTRFRTDPSPAPPKYEPAPPPPPVEGESFQQAIAGVPSGVDWKFVSSGVFSSKVLDTPNGRFSRHYMTYVAYGQTESHHVFLGVQSEENAPGRDRSVGWTALHTTAPRATNLLKLAPKMVVEIVKSLAGKSDLSKYEIPKKFKVLDGTFQEKDTRTRANLSLKDAIIGSGAMPAETSGLKGRKLVVTVEPIFNREKFRAYKESGVKREFHRAYDWVVEVNGKGRNLSDDEVETLSKNYFLGAVFSYDYSKGKKNVSKLRGGMMSAGAADALRLLHEALHGGPLKEQVGQAAEQAAAARKKAADNVVQRFIAEASYG